MTFMFSYTTVNDSLWVRCFFWRSTRDDLFLSGGLNREQHLDHWRGQVNGTFCWSFVSLSITLVFHMSCYTDYGRSLHFTAQSKIHIISKRNGSNLSFLQFLTFSNQTLNLLTANRVDVVVHLPVAVGRTRVIIFHCQQILFKFVGFIPSNYWNGIWTQFGLSLDCRTKSKHFSSTVSLQ